MTANNAASLRLTGPNPVLTNCRLWLAMDEGAAQHGVIQPSDLPPYSRLSDQDLSRWQQFRSVAKQRQFLLSRMAMAEVLRRELHDDFTSAQFVTDPSGRPMVLSNNSEILQISLSHSGSVTAIAISNDAYPVGVDVEVVESIHTDSLRSIVESPDDQEFMSSLHNAEESERLRTLWTIKESVWKSLRVQETISAMNISVQVRNEELRPVLCSDSPSEADFRVQLFVGNCPPVTRSTHQLKFGDQSKVAIRGCVTQNLTPQGKSSSFAGPLS